MHRYVIRRFLLMLPVLLGVSLLVFTMMYFSPGDPARIILGETATDADVTALRHDMGLDKSFLEQYFDYVGKAAFHLDLGTSYLTRRPVATEIWARFPTTMLLTILSVTLSVLLGIPAGIVSATRQYSIFDNLVMA
ncbi:MAG TPA: ABC transporter permease, partial [Rectinemataceae bacterium]|nr:ABC transporter permease [Rectinemataceae bacterium]